ncbi:MAG: hypothetical protein ACO331_16685 [Prochlorothrix sp.]
MSVALADGGAVCPRVGPAESSVASGSPAPAPPDGVAPLQGDRLGYDVKW